jgi:hypothetical protein
MSKMKYQLKHKARIAKTPNQHSESYLFHGVGQGSGDAPAQWGFISDTAITTYNQHSSPSIVIAPITKIKTKQSFLKTC